MEITTKFSIGDKVLAPFIEPEPLYKGRIVGINVRMDDRDNIPTSEYLVNITYDFGGREHTVLTTASEEDLKMLSDDD